MVSRPAKRAGAAARRRRQRGFTYLAALLAVALLGTALAAAGIAWRSAQRHDDERELLFVGDQFRQAIGRYYQGSPGAAKQYPPNLEALLQDARQPSVQRYLRRIYRDPITRRPQWGVVRAPEGGIAGVHSLSAERPLKQAGFAERDAAFANAARHSDWRFVYQPALASAGGMQPGSGLPQVFPTGSPVVGAPVR